MLAAGGSSSTAATLMADEGKPPAGRGSGSGRGAPRKVGGTCVCVPCSYYGHSHMHQNMPAVRQQHGPAAPAAKLWLRCRLCTESPLVISKVTQQSSPSIPTPATTCSSPSNKNTAPTTQQLVCCCTLSQHTHPLCSSRASLLNNTATA